MERDGTLSIVSGESRLDDGTLLARCDETDPVGNATSFLLNRGFQSGDPIQVTGTDGTIGGVAVFCMQNAQPASAVTALALAPSAEAKAIRAAVAKGTGGATKGKPATKKAEKQKTPSKTKHTSRSTKGQRGKRS
jgi:hypothetical protein